MTFNHPQLRPGTPNGSRFAPARAFTIVELLVVMAIITIIATASIPAIRSVSKSNDDSQATNLVRSAIGSARSIAIAQHRLAGVVFFEETATYSRPANSSQTAMQLFVEDFNQAQYGAPAYTFFVYYSPARQYLPAGMKLAVLTDLTGNIEAGDTSSGAPVGGHARVILFDSNGQLITRGGLATPNPEPPSPPAPLAAPGVYPLAYADWQFIRPLGSTPPIAAISNASSYPGFFLYNKEEYDNQPVAGKMTWLRKNSSVIRVNGNTGTVIVEKGPGQ